MVVEMTVSGLSFSYSYAEEDAVVTIMEVSQAVWEVLAAAMTEDVNGLSSFQYCSAAAETVVLPAANLRKNIK